VLDHLLSRKRSRGGYEEDEEGDEEGEVEEEEEESEEEEDVAAADDGDGRRARKPNPKVGLSGSCLPRHPSNYQPSSLE